MTDCCEVYKGPAVGELKLKAVADWLVQYQYRIEKPSYIKVFC